jgi:D-sedoheptulose 7-phosphate isomerase
MKNIIEKQIDDHLNIAKTTYSLVESIEIASQFCIDSLNNGGKILIFGNGGSAADAQHIAAELVGRYKINRKGLPAIALTTDTSSITSISNDFGYEEVFARQVEAIGNQQDILIGISTSGKSKNVNKGLKMAAIIGCRSIGLSGSDGGEMNQICDINIIVPTEDTPRIQEIHIIIGHIICHLIELKLKT